jgi:hypothetical protein
MMSMKMKNDRADQSPLSGVYQPFYVVHPFSQGIKKAGVRGFGDEISRSSLSYVNETSWAVYSCTLKSEACGCVELPAVVGARRIAYYPSSLMGCAAAADSFADLSDLNCILFQSGHICLFFFLSDQMRDRQQSCCFGSASDSIMFGC